MLNKISPQDVILTLSVLAKTCFLISISM